VCGRRPGRARRSTRPSPAGGVVDRLLDDASSLPPSCRGRTRAVGSVVRRAHAPRRGTLSTRVGGCWVNHSAAATARNLEPAGHRGRSALPLLQRHQPRAGVSSGISLLSRTTNRSATWSDPLRPVHRQDVGACELPIGRELEHRRCRDEADGAAPGASLPLRPGGSEPAVTMHTVSLLTGRSLRSELATAGSQGQRAGQSGRLTAHYLQGMRAPFLDVAGGVPQLLGAPSARSAHVGQAAAGHPDRRP
jgi:hypothetical protein